MKVKNICCIGAGYIGGPTMAVIAQKCPDINVTVVDISKQRIADWNDTDLDRLPIYEPSLKEVVRESRGRNLFFSSHVDAAIEAMEMIFISVNKPTKTYGKGKNMEADLNLVEFCVRQIARVIKSDKIVVEKSSLPVRTVQVIKSALPEAGNVVKFQILSYHEYLVEVTAITDFPSPDRILIGEENSENEKEAIDALVEVCAKWVSKDHILTTNVCSLKSSKLVSRSISGPCKETGSDAREVSKAIGMDSGMGSKFIQASFGFASKCFQKDWWKPMMIHARYLKTHKPLLSSQSGMSSKLMFGTYLQWDAKTSLYF